MWNKINCDDENNKESQQLYTSVWVCENVYQLAKQNTRSGTHNFNTRRFDTSRIDQRQAMLYGTFWKQPFFKFHQFQSFLLREFGLFYSFTHFVRHLKVFARARSFGSVCMVYVCARARLHLWWFSAQFCRSHAYIVHLYVIVAFTTIEPPYDFLTVKKVNGKNKQIKKQTNKQNHKINKFHEEEMKWRERECKNSIDCE